LGGGFQRGWHYKDQAILDQGEFPTDKFVVDKYDAVDAIDGIRNWFNKVGDYENNYYVKTIKADQLGVKSADN